MSSKAKALKLEEMEKLVAEKRERETFSRIDFLRPYPWQTQFLESSKDNAQTLLMAANRVGKTYIGAANLSYHATGLYPSWWKGHKWEAPLTCWAAGVSSESTKDILQNELLGPPDDPSMRGSGTIPKHCIGETTRKAQVPNALQSVLVKHHTNGVFDGWSRIVFKAFEQGESKFMGVSVHEIWLDEQPPDGLFTQCITRTANTGGHVTMTFTPEDGVTPVIHQFTKNRQKGQALLHATWENAPHLTKEVQEQLLSVYGTHEREMRSRGIPIFGSGPVFEAMEDNFVIDPMEIPDYWPAICGLDLGWDHPTAAVWLRWDRDADIIYVVDEYRQNKTVIAIHAASLNSRVPCPIVWPHDGMAHEKGSGVSMADQYRAAGAQMLPVHFTNPLAPGESGKGNFKVEPGINAMAERLLTGRMKVFRTCRDWLEEYRMYHREDGIIHPLQDDLMSASRYAVQSLRFAEVPSRLGSGYSRTFDSKLNYAPLHLV
jgi:phage terminase large subunit-like protein